MVSVCIILVKGNWYVGLRAIGIIRFGYLEFIDIQNVKNICLAQ